jgi:hypothetical protein
LLRKYHPRKIWPLTAFLEGILYVKRLEHASVADLDARLQETQQGLKNKVWEKEAELARKMSAATRKVFDEARKQNARIQRLDAQLQARIAVWRNDTKTLEALGEPPPVDTLAPEDRPKTSPRDAWLWTPSVRAAGSL